MGYSLSESKKVYVYVKGLLEKDPTLTYGDIKESVNKEYGGRFKASPNHHILRAKRELGMKLRRGRQKKKKEQPKKGKMATSPLKTPRKTAPVLETEDIREMSASDGLPNKVLQARNGLKKALAEFGYTGELHIRKVSEVVLPC